MNKIVLTMRYKMGYQFTWILLSFLVYISAISLTFLILIKASLITSREGSFVYRSWAFVISQFVFSMRFRSDFDFLLTLSNTRQNIYIALSGVALIFSAAFSIFIVLERFIVDQLNNLFNFTHIIDPFHFLAPYATAHLYQQFIFFFMLCCCVSMFGLLMGSLFYRFGKTFTIFFWLFLAAIPAIFLPLFVWLFYRSGQLSSSFAAAGEFFMNFDVPAGSGYLCMFTIIFGTTAYLNIRKLPQK